jgi:antirestriction protein ArdC
VVRIDGKKARALVQDALNTLCEALKAGKSDTLKNYLRAMSRFRRYSLGNVLLIAKACPHATHVAGFNSWRKMGRWVRKGERGIAILAPIVRRARGSAESQRERKPGDNSVETETAASDSAVGFKTAHVFDISQTEGKPLPECSQVTGDPGKHLDQLKRFAAERNIQLEYADSLGGADGASQGGVVRIRRGLSAAAELSTLAHELGHELIHYDKHGCSRTARETEAEAVAFIVCEAAGIDSRGASTDYIQMWNGEAETLLASLERVRNAATAIIKCLDVAKESGGGSPLFGRTAA